LAGTLSGGEGQMLALGRAFVLEPKVMMIDELSLGLAPTIVQGLVEVLHQMNKEGVAFILVEQHANLALSVTDHAYFLEKGQIRFDGRSQELLERDDLLRSVFLASATTGG
jgi:branched-chain amino acid transport system ATP-binding protein